MSLVVPLHILEECAREAELFAPFETGGVFLGWRDGGRNAIVKQMIGPGPEAIHHRTWLEVDEEWQNAQIAELHASGNPIEYLGEWHSHPAATSGIISRVDERTLLKLSQFGPLRCPDPIMMIFHREQREWNFKAWRLDYSRRRWQMFGPRSLPANVTIVAD